MGTILSDRRAWSDPVGRGAHLARQRAIGLDPGRLVPGREGGPEQLAQRHHQRRADGVVLPGLDAVGDVAHGKVARDRHQGLAVLEMVDDEVQRFRQLAPLPLDVVGKKRLGRRVDPEEGGSFGVGSNGTGPYRLVEHVIGERAVLERVPDTHFMGGAHLDRVLFFDFGDNESAYARALVSDQIDGVYEISVDQAPLIEAAEHLRIYRKATAYTVVARGKMNQPPFDDPRVMKAVRLATDNAKTVETALRNLAVVGDHTHVSPIHPEWKDLGAFPHDVEQARALLAEAGYPDGIDLEIAVKTQPALELNAAQVMVEDWAKAGIRAKLEVMPESLFWDRWMDFPFSLTPWAHRPLASMVLNLAYRTGAPWNESAFSNPDFDELLTQLNGTVDPDDRADITGRLMDIMREVGPIAQPAFMQVAAAYNNRVKGFEMHPTKTIFVEELAIGDG